MIQPLSPRLRLFFWICLAVQTPVMALLFIRWIQTHGFWGGMKLWVEHGLEGPIFMFAEIDFLALMLFVVVLCWRELGGLWRQSKALWLGWSLFFTVCPSIAFLLFLLFKDRIDSRT